MGSGPVTSHSKRLLYNNSTPPPPPMGTRETVGDLYIKKVTQCPAEDPGQAKIKRTSDV